MPKQRILKPFSTKGPLTANLFGCICHKATADAARSFVSHPLARCEAETWTTVQVKRKAWSLRSLTHDMEGPEPEVSGPMQKGWNLEPLVHCNVEAEGLLGLLKQRNFEVLSTLIGKRHGTVCTFCLESTGTLLS